MGSFLQVAPRFVIAIWVMTAVVAAISYGLCLGTVAVFVPHHDQNAARQI